MSLNQAKFLNQGSSFCSMLSPLPFEKSRKYKCEKLVSSLLKHLGSSRKLSTKYTSTKRRKGARNYDAYGNP